MTHHIVLIRTICVVGLARSGIAGKAKLLYIEDGEAGGASDVVSKYHTLVVPYAYGKILTHMSLTGLYHALRKLEVAQHPERMVSSLFIHLLWQPNQIQKTAGVISGQQ